MSAYPWKTAICAVAFGFFAAPACSPIIETHGIEPNRDIVESFELGRTRQEDVNAAFGSPLAEGTFRSDVWYYVFERAETIAFFEPKIAYRRVYAFDFDDGGVLENVASLTEADGRSIDFESRVTPSRGTEANFIQELFGNIGRFTGDADQVLPTGRPGGPP